MTVVEALIRQHWALERGTFLNLSSLVLRHSRGERLSPEAIEQAMDESPSRERERLAQDRRPPEGIAMIPVQGVIARHARQVNGISQRRGKSIDRLRSRLADALQDDEVEAILLDVDSPGGSVSGLQEFAEDVRAVRGEKPIVAHVDGLCASAALWIAAQADRIYTTRSSEIGSIGVYAPLVDDERLFKNEGVDIEVVSSGGVKGQGFPGTRRSSELRDEIQAGVDRFLDWFVEAVAMGRDLSEEEVRALADGRVHFAEQAIELGLADEIASIDDVFASLLEGNGNLQARGLGTGAVMTKTKEEEPAAAQPTTADQLAAQFPTLVQGIRDEASAQGRAEGEKAERARATGILRTATSSQQKLATKLVVDGASLDEAQSQLHDDPDREKSSALAARMAAAPEPRNGAAPAPTPAGDSGEAKPDEQAEDPLKAEFEKDPNKVEGETFEQWKAFRDAASEGRVSLQGGKG
ncbi:MAG: S49 family peptidase [Planctomycetota bacterium]